MLWILIAVGLLELTLVVVAIIYSMWWLMYIVGGILVAFIVFVVYIARRGYNKVKPDPLKDIPIPPLSHPIFGHPEKMLHPLKHEMRLQVCDAARGPYHQLVLMKHASVFINDSREAGNLVSTMSTKGAIYNSFRYDAEIPDLLASDGKDWERRRDALGAALVNMQIPNESRITASLNKVLTEYAETGESVDLVGLFTPLAFDCVCEAAFGYELDAVAGSEDGKRLYESLCALSDAQSAGGLYPNKFARVVPESELTEAKKFWRSFLNKLLDFTRTSAEQHRAKHGEVDSEHNFGHALIVMSFSEESYGDAQLISEIHQVLRHGYETIAGTLVWIFHALYRNPKVRATLESAIVNHKKTPESPYPEYLDLVILEAMRRFPVVGNMTVRTVDNDRVTLKGGVTVPVGTPIHFHMWSLHNTNRNWEKPKEFLPERWQQPNSDEPHEEFGPRGERIAPKGAPRCPFMASQVAAEENDKLTAFDGVGHFPGALCFFPFSVGPRACPAKKLSLQVLRRVLMDIVPNFRMDPYEQFWEEDDGASMNAVIMPYWKKSVTVKVTRAKDIGVATKTPTTVVEEEEGWADDDDDEDKYQKIEVPKDE